MGNLDKRSTIKRLRELEQRSGDGSGGGISSIFLEGWPQGVPADESRFLRDPQGVIHYAYISHREGPTQVSSMLNGAGNLITTLPSSGYVDGLLFPGSEWSSEPLEFDPEDDNKLVNGPFDFYMFVTFKSQLTSVSFVAGADETGLLPSNIKMYATDDAGIEALSGGADPTEIDWTDVTGSAYTTVDKYNNFESPRSMSRVSNPDNDFVSTFYRFSFDRVHNLSDASSPAPITLSRMELFVRSISDVWNWAPVIGVDTLNLLQETLEVMNQDIYSLSSRLTALEEQSPDA